MKKKIKKNGFTLIELLAVIAILAVIMLIGGQSVFGALDNARKGAFKTEVGYAIQAAQSAYQIDLLNQKATDEEICYPITWLISQDLYKKDGKEKGEYKGSVLVQTAVGGGKAKYTIWMQGQKYIVTNGTLDNLSTEGTANADGVITSRSTATASVNCSSKGKLRTSIS